MWIEFAGGAALSVAGVTAYGVRAKSSSLFGPSVWRGPSDRPAIALSFDDGPSESTAELLEILERHRARATFFECGVNVRRLPAVAREVAAAGHEIGNHGDTHSPFYLRSAAFIEGELERAQAAIAEATGCTAALMRAPYGARWFGLRGAQKRLGLLGVMWTAIARDWVLGAAQIIGRLERRASNGAIFCLHDGRGVQPKPDVRETVRAVGRLVPELQSRGFQLETISELLCPRN
jgi:peptidoglycan/xylan/chitin deacetylase (PgdA/CDA1 family)